MEAPGKTKEAIEEQLYQMHEVKSFRGVCFKKCKVRDKECDTCMIRGGKPTNFVPMNKEKT